MKNLLVPVSVIVGVLFLFLAITYAALPARNLPMFIPGYAVGLAKHHYTHAFASFGLSVVCFAFAWMKSKKK